VKPDLSFISTVLNDSGKEKKILRRKLTRRRRGRWGARRGTLHRVTYFSHVVDDDLIIGIFIFISCRKRPDTPQKRAGFEGKKRKFLNK
tara:strand:+ start:198 stop:464 length:267 start_codon:yes stop_codon:yes gene_type:complete